MTSARPGQLRLGRREPADHLERGADRRQRVAQLVREHREELVLAPVRAPAASPRRRAAPRSRSAGCGTGGRSRARSPRASASSCELAQSAPALGRRRSAPPSALAGGRPAAARRTAVARAAPARGAGVRSALRSASRVASRERCRRSRRRTRGSPRADAASPSSDAGRARPARRRARAAPSRANAAPASRAAARRRDLDVERAAEHAARLRQEVRAPRVLLGDRARRLGRGERDPLVGLPAQAPLHQVQVDEDLDLRAQDLRHDRREDVVDRAERVAARPSASRRRTAVTKMIGVCAERLYWRISAAVSKPSMSGMLTSSRITANSCLQDSLQRLAARARADEFWPRSSSTVRKTSSFSGRSSTIRMLARSPSLGRSSVVEFASSAAQPAPQHREQVHRVDRLGEVVPGAGLDALLRGRPSSPWR